MVENINSKAYWDRIYLEEKKEWRNYPLCFEFVVDEISPSDIVIELGCGTGILGKMIADKAFYYTGYDISGIAVKKAKDRGLYALQFDIMKQPICVNEQTIVTSSVIVATEFLEHFTYTELIKILPKICAAAPKAIFAVPNDCLDNSQCREHYQCFEKKSLKNLLQHYYKDIMIVEFVEVIPKVGRLPTLFAVCKDRW